MDSVHERIKKLLCKERHGPLLTAIAWVVLIAAAPLPYKVSQDE